MKVISHQGVAKGNFCSWGWSKNLEDTITLSHLTVQSNGQYYCRNHVHCRANDCAKYELSHLQSGGNIELAYRQRDGWKALIMITQKEQRVKDVCDLYINRLHKRNNQNWQPDIFHQICPFPRWNETPQASSHTDDGWQDAICRDMGGDSFDRHGWCAVSQHDTGTLNSKLQRDTNGSNYDGRLHLVLCLLVDGTNMECVMVTCTDVYMDKNIHIHGSTGKLSKQCNGTTEKKS